MQPFDPPKAKALRIVATQPAAHESAVIAHLSADSKKAIDPVAYLVKVELKEKMPYTGSGWALYVGGTRIAKYWEYEKGIYFTVLDAGFFAEHRGKKLRFTMDGETFVDAGVKLDSPEAKKAEKTAAALKRLPTQEEALR